MQRQTVNFLLFFHVTMFILCEGKLSVIFVSLPLHLNNIKGNHYIGSIVFLQHDLNSMYSYFFHPLQNSGAH